MRWRRDGREKCSSNVSFRVAQQNSLGTGSLAKSNRVPRAMMNELGELNVERSVDNDDSKGVDNPPTFFPEAQKVRTTLIVIGTR